MLLVPRLDKVSKIPMYEQLYEYIKSEIISRHISENSRLPSIRQLADFLDISATTVELAYNQLLDEGFIKSKFKSGFFVQTLPETIGLGVTSSGYKEEPQRYTPKKTYKYDFHLAKNDFTAFPFQTWRKLHNQMLNLEQKDLLFYGDPHGDEGLRIEISKYLHQYRGVHCSPGQIIVAADQYILITFISAVLKKYSARIAFEDPSYVLMKSTFQQQGFHTIPISLEKDGISIKKLYDSKAQVVSVSPSHQYPKGMIMPISKRLSLLEWGEQRDGFIIEDDYDGEFRYHGKPIPALQGLLPDSNVIYMSGFSQVLAPAFCIHYMVLPKTLLDDFMQLQQHLLFEQSSSPIHQRTLQLFMENGYLTKHISKMRKIYRKKHDLIIDVIHHCFGEKAEIMGGNAGFHILLKVHSTKSEKELIRLANDSGIRIASTSYMWFSLPKEERREFILGFTGIEMDKIEDGIKLLYDVWFERE
ncbi:MocR-like pyridoxine biosynthesis transcription factor PdxR [Chengkuizengella axinellae]|uniref:PLP-dependent aminotransferase family protein n=1 Tax=Chengkuizengella axinellae TaxID=3064388 RepID=A0ABT9J1D8_9BACL|nr:PLP-dependent aminotransferase family protein [Chengkuizengella sp. 2205SS18-9]MDP5275388.1 PLP-dependent aminotransferase family protein [Chengkuizengella sp. 2205SS18-9]